jgi:hypothetical protein
MLSILAVKLTFRDSYNRSILRDLLGNAGFELIEAERCADCGHETAPEPNPHGQLPPTRHDRCETARRIKSNPEMNAILKGLCEAGFSLAVYGYTEGFHGTQQIRCTNSISGEQNTLTYIAGGASRLAFEQDVMSQIQTVVGNPNAGPVFVHCWNGDHASGELASFALRQFCGWSGPAPPLTGHATSMARLRFHALENSIRMPR